eukprot:TRINITY_DN13494_c0_g1_i1.p1 TRINITY_DN13494_c0_g1~~TRINITY_DN13494_c0_g1_i1.p1  ORF type:complete len:166 (+),score=19.08 TRINITY_DN13494_c0_g1_i1:38-499(+)
MKKACWALLLLFGILQTISFWFAIPVRSSSNENEGSRTYDRVGGLLEVSSLPEQNVNHFGSIKKRVILKNGQIPHITQFAKAIIPPGEVVEEHNHLSMYESFLVLKGEGKLIINGRTRIIAEDHFFWMVPGESHSIVNNSTSDLILLYFGVAA